MTYSCRLPCHVFCICMMTNINNKKYKSVELGDQLDTFLPGVNMTGGNVLESKCSVFSAKCVVHSVQFLVFKF